MRDRYCRRIAAILTIMAGLVWGLPVLAAEPKLIDVLGPTKLTIPPGNIGDQTATLEVPVRLLQPSNDITLQTASVSLGGNALDSSVFTFKLKPQDNKALGTLEVTINRQQADQTGEYTVTLLAWLLKAAASPVQSQAPPPPGKPKNNPLVCRPEAAPPAGKPEAAPPAGKPGVPTPEGKPEVPPPPEEKPQAKLSGGKPEAPPPAGKPEAKTGAKKDPEPASQKLTFTFSKPAAKLQLMSTRIEQIIRIPWLWSSLSPNKVVLSETGGESNLSPYEQQWLYELTRKDGQPLPGKLLVSGLKPIGAWKQEDAQVNIEGSLPLGTAKGTVTIRAPELATHQAVFNVEVDTRASLFWLVILLVVSIGFGFFFRNVLEERKKRTEARIAAEEQRGVLLELINKTVDEEIKKKYMAVKEELVTAIREKAKKPDELTDAAKDAKEKTEAILKQATATRDKLADQINKWLTALRPLDQTPAVRAAINQATDRLTKQQADLEAGRITQVEKGFENEKQAFLKEIHRSLTTWLRDVEWARTNKKPWPDNRYNPELSPISQAVTKLEGQIGDISEPDKLGKLLSDTDNLRWDLENTLFEKHHGKEIINDAEEIREKMEQLYPDPSKISLDELAAAISSYAGELEAENRPDNLRELIEAEARLWDSLKEVLKEGYNLETNKPEKFDDLLEAGKFSEAYNALKTAHEKASQRALDEPYEGVPPEELITKGSPEAYEVAKKPVPPPVWLIAIKVPGEVFLGEPVTVELSVATPSGQPVPKLVVRWAVAGEPKLRMQGSPGVLIWQFTPPRSGTIVVQAEAELPETGEKRSTSAVIEIMPRFPVVEELREKLWKSDLIQTVVSGVVLSVIGYAIFRGSFVGTVDDIVAVSLWGFTLDIGGGQDSGICEACAAAGA